MDFGFTNDPQQIAEIRAWRDAAIADGWSAAPIYAGHESIDRATRLTREGFVVQVITREKVGRWLYEAKLSLWGPDGMACRKPRVYDWAAIAAAPRSCNYCNATDVDTHLVGFAARCCAACVPIQRPRIERPGWNL